MTPPYEERSRYNTAMPFFYIPPFMCSCGSPIGIVEQHNGRYRLRYRVGTSALLIYWGTVTCRVCGNTREFHGGLCSEMGDEPTTEMPPG